MKERDIAILRGLSFGSIIAIVLLVISYNVYNRSRVYVIDDHSYLMSVLNESLPNNLQIEDPVWGVVNIRDSRLIFDYYDYMNYLISMGEQSQESNDDIGNSITGILSFSSGNSISFELGNYAVLDGRIYGNENNRIELNVYISKLKNYLYNKENLAEIINAQNRIQLRVENEKKTLATEDKKKIKQVLMEGIIINSGGESWNKVYNKGEVLFQIECYVEEDELAPGVHMVFYESGLCMVYDSHGNQSGSVMQIKTDVLDLYEYLIKEVEDEM